MQLEEVPSRKLTDPLLLGTFESMIWLLFQFVGDMLDIAFRMVSVFSSLYLT